MKSRSLSAVVFLAAALLPALILPAFPADPETVNQPYILTRLAEEAEVFAENLPNSLTQETLIQRELLPMSRLRPPGPGAAQPSPQLRVRQIVSEYSVGTFKESASHDLHEFREVVSVDGRAVRSAASARHALSLGVQGEDDRIRKRMLEDFAHYGLDHIATDYALLLLAFGKREQANLEIEPPRSAANIGTDAVLSLNWKQKSETRGETEFAGRRIVRQALRGVLWVRQSDGLPVRIEAWAQYSDHKTLVRDQATVDYVLSPHGFLAPVSVVHRHMVDGRLVTENLYKYQPFRKFSSDADIKFTEVPDQPPSASGKPRK
jgi:hypothetical protein